MAKNVKPVMGINVRDFLEAELATAKSLYAKPLQDLNEITDKLRERLSIFDSTLEFTLPHVSPEACMTYTPQKMAESYESAESWESDIESFAGLPSNPSQSDHLRQQLLYDSIAESDEQHDKIYRLVQTDRLSCHACLNADCDKRDPNVPVEQVLERAKQFDQKD